MPCRETHEAIGFRPDTGGSQQSWDELPAPDGPLTVGIDGGYVRGQHEQGQFEVIAGNSLLAFKRDFAILLSCLQRSARLRW